MNVENMNEDERAVLTAVMYNLIFLNDCAINSLLTALDKLQASKYYRHDVRRWAAVIRKDMRAYNILLDKATDGKIDFIASLNDEYAVQVDLDLLKLNEAAKIELGRLRYADAELLASLYIAGTLMAGTCNNNDHAFDQFPEYKHWHRRFRWLRLTDMTQAFERLMAGFRKMAGVTGYEDRLDRNMNVMNGFKVLGKKFSDADNIIDTYNRHAEVYDSDRLN